MIAAKNRYSKSEREWSVMIDKDGLIRLYIWQGRWKTVNAPDKPTPGRWHLVGITIQTGKAELWVDGERAGELKLDADLPRTKAPLTSAASTMGDASGRLCLARSTTSGFSTVPLTAEEMAALYQPVEAPHELPEAPTRFALLG